MVEYQEWMSWVNFQEQGEMNYVLDNMMCIVPTAHGCKKHLE